MPTTKATGPAKIRIFLVDDHPIVRRGLQLLINFERDMIICGEADSERAALEKIAAVNPDLAIVDLKLRAGSGLELIKQLHKEWPKLKILVFSMRDETIFAERALRYGAYGYITKEEGPEQAIAAIRLLMRGKCYLSERMAAKMLESMAGGRSGKSDSFASLSDRELQILEQIGNGRCSREIAEQLYITVKTVESHREHIKAKLSLKNASELVSYAFDRFRSEERRQVESPGSSDFPT